MNYSNGELVLLGDKVSLGAGLTGVVVAVIDTQDFSEGYVPDQWLYLSKGVLVESPEAGLVHYPDLNDDFLLLERLKTL